MSFDQREFRDALGKFATGITVVTTKTADDQNIGVTINSFASVSLEPPLVLFSLKTESNLTDVFLNQPNFNICILSETQENVSNLFAGPEEDKFSKVDWTEGENGSPVLKGTLATLECKRAETHKGGDHTIFVGEVTNMDLQDNGGPLLYFQGGYKTL
ncbi:NADH:riboflavin 5'-phosphate oxidoreductase [Candidatus Terasakiella magnetica]|uniref:NADH:riboflavin 5'-phosphate oxidoreductase n=1 Tax=Candidatus Terasakiella magnetica TaxID=1867952 RepID=A0A1C3RCY4_9PROT|nr:flavin reductase family protein [Candidatus Terasakiella magnetica]SCA55108.1 NADH:riboflavin 5'-phosphate oxidoreductase [Candidatus Terasakiella magnetica]